MLAVLHHASLNGEMFASNRFMRSRIRWATPVCWPGAVGCCDQCLRNFPL